jgi:TetR/AcrR family transcriptional repressor of mexJK operon
MAASSVKADDKRRAILDIAREVFMTEGYAAASMSTIAARLGGSKGTLYNYFPSKEALFAEFMRDQCQAEADAVYELAEGDDDIRRALCEVGKRLMRFIFSDKVQSIHRLAIAESERFPELGRAFYENGPRVGILRLAGYLEGWMDAGRLHRADPIRTAERFGDLCKAGLYQRMMWNVERATDAQIDENVDEAVRIFMAAYGA